ncbi:hypothetical protein IFR23_11710 [Sphingomonas sp. CFBP 13603]|uniref:hypothetical protein n=1 Tax=Sphingomonas sp. CFBP 13603 TaxID=2774040 RepID=UPI001868163E|nr:hypothetical protein [Sphingomonas sp. CFBP 13603]MBE2992681.1 hypothetical protein [Sphingomonas sp. CFBP 13603]
MTITFDENQSKARAVRRLAFSAFADGRTLVAAPHLAFPGVDHIAREGTGYRWIPIEYANRTVAATSLDAQ